MLCLNSKGIITLFFQVRCIKTMNLNQIELLRVLQETQFSLSHAADKMHIVQSAVSRQLQLFEAEIGSPLFERKGKKLVAMTPLGLRIMQEINTISQAKRNIQSIAADYLKSDHGVLHIATTHTQAKYFLPKPILRFREKYPNVRIYWMKPRPSSSLTNYIPAKPILPSAQKKWLTIPI